MGKFIDAGHRAKAITNKQLANEIASLYSLTPDQIQDLMPEKKDQLAFLNLMEEVKKETTVEQKIVFLKDNIETAGKMVFKLLNTLF